MLRVMLRVLLAFLSCTGHGRRVRISTDRFQSKSSTQRHSGCRGATKPLNGLARFLLAFNPTQGWEPTLTILRPPARCKPGAALRASASRACAPPRKTFAKIDYTREDLFQDPDIVAEDEAFDVDEPKYDFGLDQLDDEDEIEMPALEDSVRVPNEEYESDEDAWQPEGLLKKFVKEKEAEVKTWEKLPENKEDGSWWLKLRYPSYTSCFRLGRAIGNRPEKPVVFADLKRSSPSGEFGEIETLKEDLNVLDALGEAMNLGCTGAFVAVDSDSYRGSYSDLKAACTFVKKLGPEDATNEDERVMPIVAKDIIVNPLQIARAACSGAKAVLLIAGACLADLEDLIDSCVLMGMESVVEVHTRQELAIAAEAIASTILVNERNRATGELVPGRALELAPYLPPISQYLVCGNISTIEQVREYRRAGYDGFVLGRALLGDPDKAKALMQEILGEPEREWGGVIELIRAKESTEESLRDEQQDSGDDEQKESKDDEHKDSEDGAQQASDENQQYASDIGNQQASQDTGQPASDNEALPR